MPSRKSHLLDLGALVAILGFAAALVALGVKAESVGIIFTAASSFYLAWRGAGGRPEGDAPKEGKEVKQSDKSDLPAAEQPDSENSDASEGCP